MATKTAPKKTAPKPKAATKTAATELQKELQKTVGDATRAVKTTAEDVQRDLVETAGDVRDAVHNVFLAGLGALAVTEEEGSKLFKKLVKKGDKVKLPGLGTERLAGIRAQLTGAADKAEDAVKGRAADAKYVAGSATDKVEDTVQDAVQAVMKRLGVPTREEVSELTASVERLTKHIETLKTERAQSNELTLEAVGGGWYEIKIGDVVVEKVQGKEDAEKALLRVQEARG